MATVAVGSARAPIMDDSAHARSSSTHSDSDTDKESSRSSRFNLISRLAEPSVGSAFAGMGRQFSRNQRPTTGSTESGSRRRGGTVRSLQSTKSSRALHTTGRSTAEVSAARNYRVRLFQGPHAQEQVDAEFAKKKHTLLRRRRMSVMPSPAGLVVVEEDRDLTLNPSSRYLRVWDIVLFICLLFSAIVTPYEVAYLDVSKFDALFVINRMVEVVYAIDIILQFFLPYTTSDGNNVTQLGDIALHQLKGHFWIDVVSAFPFPIFARHRLDTMAVLQLLKALRLSRFFRLVRVLSGARVLNQWKNRVGMQNSVVSLTRFVVLIVLLAHWGACLFFVVAIVQLDPSITWVGTAGLEDASAYDQYINSMYFAIASIVTIGYGDISAETVPERTLAVFLMLMGAGMYAYVIGATQATLASYDPAAAQFSKDMDALNLYMDTLQLPHELRVDLREFFDRSIHVHRENYYRRLLLLLSPELRRKVASVRYREWLARIPFFSSRNEMEMTEFAGAIAVELEPAAFSPLELILRHGFVNRRLYIITRGIAAMRRTGRISGVGSYFGEEMILTDGRTTQPVSSVTMLFTMTLHRSNLFKVLETGNFESIRKSIRRDTVLLALRRELLRCVALTKLHRGRLKLLTAVRVSRAQGLIRAVGAGKAKSRPPPLEVGAASSLASPDSKAAHRFVSPNARAAATLSPDQTAMLKSPVRSALKKGAKVIPKSPTSPVRFSGDSAPQSGKEEADEILTLLRTASKMKMHAGVASSPGATRRMVAVQSTSHMTTRAAAARGNLSLAIPEEDESDSNSSFSRSTSTATGIGASTGQMPQAVQLSEPGSVVVPLRPGAWAPAAATTSRADSSAQHGVSTAEQADTQTTGEVAEGEGAATAAEPREEDDGEDEETHEFSAEDVPPDSGSVATPVASTPNPPTDLLSPSGMVGFNLREAGSSDAQVKQYLRRVNTMSSIREAPLLSKIMLRTSAMQGMADATPEVKAQRRAELNELLGIPEDDELEYLQWRQRVRESAAGPILDVLEAQGIVSKGLDETRMREFHPTTISQSATGSMLHTTASFRVAQRLRHAGTVAHVVPQSENVLSSHGHRGHQHRRRRRRSPPPPDATPTPTGALVRKPVIDAAAALEDDITSVAASGGAASAAGGADSVDGSTDARTTVVPGSARVSLGVDRDAAGAAAAGGGGGRGVAEGDAQRRALHRGLGSATGSFRLSPLPAATQLRGRTATAERGAMGPHRGGE